MTTYTNEVTHLEVTDIGPGETEFYLGDYIPNGAILPSDVQVRVRPVGAYWQQWESVNSWDNDSLVATVTRGYDIERLQFKRVTQYTSLIDDPQSRTARVNKRNMQTNADQGLFVVEDLARASGLDPLVLLLEDPASGESGVVLPQYTQNHYTQNLMSRKTWDFQFAGGYIDRADVKVQVLLGTGWANLLVDPSENDPDDPSDEPFRFVGDFQLHLDLSTLGEEVSKVVIYRHTPRGAHITTPDDGDRIRATNMEPSARHAFFVAIEVGEELARNAASCDCALYFTSLIYPYQTIDTMSFGRTNWMSGVVWGIDDDTAAFAKVAITGGTLIPILNPVSYTDGRDYNPDLLQFAHVEPMSGTLTVVINYIHYTNGRDYAPDTLEYPHVELMSGTLTVVIAYLNYTNGRDYAPDTAAFAKPALQSGTLV